MNHRVPAHYRQTLTTHRFHIIFLAENRNVQMLREMWQISHYLFFWLWLCQRCCGREVAKGKPRDVTMSCYYNTLLKVDSVGGPKTLCLI